MSRKQSRFYAYIDDRGTPCCGEGHATRAEAVLHAVERMREKEGRRA